MRGRRFVEIFLRDENEIRYQTTSSMRKLLMENHKKVVGKLFAVKLLKQFSLGTCSKVLWDTIDKREFILMKDFIN